MSAAARPPEGGARVLLGGTGRQAEGATVHAAARPPEGGARVPPGGTGRPAEGAAVHVAARPPEGGARVPLGGTGRQAEGATVHDAVGDRQVGQAGRALRRAWRELSGRGRWLIALTLLALLVAATLAGALTPAWQRAADADAQATLAAQRAWRQRPLPPVARPAAPGWRSGLPDASAADLRLAELLDSALRHGLTVARSQQQWRELAPAAQPGAAAQAAAIAAAEPGVSALLLTMQVEGSYADLRSWVGDALAADPQLALDALRLQRPTAASAQFSAELQWALLQRAAAAARDAAVTTSPQRAGANQAAARVGAP